MCVSHPVRLQDSLINNISICWVWPVVSLVQSDYRIFWSSVSLGRINWCLAFFCMWLVNKGRQRQRLPILVWYGQVCLLFSQRAIFFDHQYLWKESIDTLDALHWDNHQGKVGDLWLLLFVRCSQQWLSSVRLQDSLVISTSRKNQVIS